MRTMHLLPGVAIQPKLELKTWPKPVLGSLPLAFVLPNETMFELWGGGKMSFDKKSVGSKVVAPKEAPNLQKHCFTCAKSYKQLTAASIDILLSRPMITIIRCLWLLLLNRLQWPPCCVLTLSYARKIFIPLVTVLRD